MFIRPRGFLFLTVFVLAPTQKHETSQLTFVKMIFYTEAKELQASLQVTLLLRSAPSLIQLLAVVFLAKGLVCKVGT